MEFILIAGPISKREIKIGIIIKKKVVNIFSLHICVDQLYYAIFTAHPIILISISFKQADTLRNIY